ncbi:hypothetical protein N9F08_00450 [bacterium]|nr:hypothetical protein [bacterium]
MKLITLISLVIFIIKSENTNAQTYDLKSTEYLAIESIKALQNDSFNDFKKLSLTLDIYRTQDSTITVQSFDEILISLFEKSKEEFFNENVEINDLRFHHCDTPYKEYDYNDLTLVRFYAYFELSNGKLIKIKFSDSIKTNVGYKLSEILNIKDL